MSQNLKPKFVRILGKDGKSYRIEVLNPKIGLKVHHYFHLLLMSTELTFRPRFLHFSELSSFVQSALWEDSSFSEAVPLLYSFKPPTNIIFKFYPYSKECSILLEYLTDVIKFLRNEAFQLQYDYVVLSRLLAFPRLAETMNWLLNIPEELWKWVSQNQYNLNAFSDLVYVHHLDVKRLPYYLPPLVWAYFSLIPRFLIKLAALRDKVLPAFRRKLNYLLEWSKLDDSIILDNTIALDNKFD